LSAQDVSDADMVKSVDESTMKLPASTATDKEQSLELITVIALDCEVSADETVTVPPAPHASTVNPSPPLDSYV
jgi:hypothetical protein